MSYFLTNYNTPDQTIWKNIFLNQWETQSILISPTGSFLYNVDVNVYSNSFVGIGTYSFTNLTMEPQWTMFSLGVGTKNLNGVTASVGGVISLNEGNYYTVKIYDSCDNALLRRKVVKNCSVFPNIRILFLNRLGGFDWYNFNYDSKITLDIERKTYNKTLDYNYEIGDRGRSTMTIDASEQTIANTDWISQYDYNFLQELLTSPNVYVYDEDNDLKLPILITDTTWEQKTIYREVIFNLTITFKYAYSLNLQSY